MPQKNVDYKVRMAMGAAIRELRLRMSKRTIPQREIAQRLGVSTQLYSAWEDGRRSIRADFLPRVLRVLKARPKDFVGLLTYGTPGTSRNREVVHRCAACRKPVPPVIATRLNPVSGETRIDDEELDRAILGGLTGDEIMDVIEFVKTLKGGLAA